MRAHKSAISSVSVPLVFYALGMSQSNYAKKRSLSPSSNLTFFLCQSLVLIESNTIAAIMHVHAAARLKNFSPAQHGHELRVTWQHQTPELHKLMSAL